MSRQENDPTDDETIKSLTELSEPGYDRARQSAAKDLGVSLRTLDSEVKSKRNESEDTDTKGRVITFYETEP